MSTRPDLAADATNAPTCTCAAGVPNSTELSLGVARAILAPSDRTA